MDLAKHKKKESTFELGSHEPSKRSIPERSKPEENEALVSDEHLKNTLSRPPFHERIETKKHQVNSWVKTQTGKIQTEEDDPPTQEERKKSNLKKLIGWSITGGLSLVFCIAGLTLDSAAFIPGVALAFNILFALSSLILPIALILIIFYGLEQFAIKKNKTIFTPRFLKTLGNVSIAFSIIGAVLLLAQVAVVLIFIFTFGPADLIAQILLFLVYLIILGILAVLYQLSLIASISTAILSAKKTKQGRIAAIIMAIALVLTIIIMTVLLLVLL